MALIIVPVVGELFLSVYSAGAAVLKRMRVALRHRALPSKGHVGLTEPGTLPSRPFGIVEGRRAGAGAGAGIGAGAGAGAGAGVGQEAGFGQGGRAHEANQGDEGAEGGPWTEAGPWTPTGLGPGIGATKAGDSSSSVSTANSSRPWSSEVRAQGCLSGPHAEGF